MRGAGLVLARWRTLGRGSSSPDSAASAKHPAACETSSDLEEEDATVQALVGMFLVFD